MYSLIIKTMKNEKLISVSSKIFNEFDEAYDFLRKTLKELGLKNSGVFDGNGNIKEMLKYFKYTEKECRKEDWWSEDYMNPIWTEHLGFMS